MLFAKSTDVENVAGEPKEKHVQLSKAPSHYKTNLRWLSRQTWKTLQVNVENVAGEPKEKHVQFSKAPSHYKTNLRSLS